MGHTENLSSQRQNDGKADDGIKDDLLWFFGFKSLHVQNVKNDLSKNTK
jgi:hypothetical protein